MWAALIQTCGAPSVVTTRRPPEQPDGTALVAVTAAPITPLDVLCATGISYFGAPAVPYVPGIQGVGIVRCSAAVPVGTVVWFATDAGMRPGDGSMAELCAVPDAELVPLPNGVDQPLAAALGLSAVAAWRALTWRGEMLAGEQVLVLGAGGVVGQVAVQAARLHGARRVVAACRSRSGRQRAHRLGADAVVGLTDADDVGTLTSRLLDACDGPVDLVLDALCGVPAAAALRTLRPRGRLVNLGSSAGETAPFDSATLRSRSLRVLGYTNNELTAEQRMRALGTIVQHAVAGRIEVAYKPVPLTDAATAWARQAAGQASRRIVLTTTTSP
ncbi:zinc-binding dehydrogenase [Streptomyces flavidovirens]|uniref:quinone oxidoreductase family protein n=1 Tax=Streptomyces flavidovirens TaxID=67298 RepID=UPI0034341322